MSRLRLIMAVDVSGADGSPPLDTAELISRCTTDMAMWLTVNAWSCGSDCP